MIIEGRKCLTYRKITSLSAVVPCPERSGGAVQFQAETQAIRYRFDGVDPDTSTGFICAVGSSVFYVGDLSLVKFIEDTAGGVLHVHVFE